MNYIRSIKYFARALLVHLLFITSWEGFFKTVEVLRRLGSYMAYLVLLLVEETS